MSEIQIDREKLLSDKRVIEEIQRHLWIESEKAGHDIGFESAKEDWMKNFAIAWMEYHMPEELAKAKKASAKNFIQKLSTVAHESAKKFQEYSNAGSTAMKRRRAKSYF
jgi:hypothetical protein